MTDNVNEWEKRGLQAKETWANIVTTNVTRY